MRVVIIGLSITSSWGNGHATTYRALVRELDRAGHDILFLEHDKPWYAGNRDLPDPPFGRTRLYDSVETLKSDHKRDVADADAVIVGSYVPQGVEVGEWVLATAGGRVAFYDIDTPVTLAKLRRGDFEYVTPDLVRRYPLYLSFSGGGVLDVIESEFGSPRARALHCSVDPELYGPDESLDAELRYDLTYLGTYSDDRQPTLNKLLIEPARRWSGGTFSVAGPMYPESILWPTNVERIEHLPPAQHRAFYNQSRWTLNVTRADMIAAGWSPSVRLFEAAACGTPIVSDCWTGLDDYFKIGTEIVTADSSDEALAVVRDMPESERKSIAHAARQTVLSHHTSAHRAAELVAHLNES